MKQKTEEAEKLEVSSRKNQKDMKTTNFLTVIALAATLAFSSCGKTEPENTGKGTLTVAMSLTDGLTEPSSLTFYLFDSEGTAQREDYNDYSTLYSFTLSPGTYTVVAVANIDSWLPTADQATTLGIDGLVTSLINLRNTNSDMLTGYTEATVVADETEIVVLTLKNGVLGLPGVGVDASVTFTAPVIDWTTDNDYYGDDNGGAVMK